MNTHKFKENIDAIVKLGVRNDDTNAVRFVYCPFCKERMQLEEFLGNFNGQNIFIGECKSCYHFILFILFFGVKDKTTVKKQKEEKK